MSQTTLLVMWDTIGEAQPGKLVENEMFISTLQTAAGIAGKNHQREKREALRNAVLNSALPNSLEENEQFMFMNLVDRFTPLHLTILECLQNPRDYALKNGQKLPNMNTGGKGTVLEALIPEIKGRKNGVTPNYGLRTGAPVYAPRNIFEISVLVSE